MQPIVQIRLVDFFSKFLMHAVSSFAALLCQFATLFMRQTKPVRYYRI